MKKMLEFSSAVLSTPSPYPEYPIFSGFRIQGLSRTFARTFVDRSNIGLTTKDILRDTPVVSPNMTTTGPIFLHTAQ